MSLSNEKSIALYQAIAADNKERVFKYNHASSMGGCPRMHFYKRKAIPETAPKPSGAKVLRWSAGHHIETAIRPYVEAVYGELASNERMTNEKLQLTGEFDNLAIVDNRLIEIKSVSDFAFIQRDNVTSLKQATGKKNKWGKDEYEPRTTPYLGHELQNHCYVMLLKEEKGIEVTDIDYVYISLSGRMVVYETKVQQNIIDNVNRRIEAINKAMKTNLPPTCVCYESHPLWGSVTQYCPYQQEGKECCSKQLMEVSMKKENEEIDDMGASGQFGWHK